MSLAQGIGGRTAYGGAVHDTEDVDARDKPGHDD